MGAINDWARSGGQPAPDHPKLLSYNTRRLHHLLKLCMVAALACDSELIITVDHFVEALDWLVELETFMPDIFKSMRTGGDDGGVYAVALTAGPTLQRAVFWDSSLVSPTFFRVKTGQILL